MTKKSKHSDYHPNDDAYSRSEPEAARPPTVFVSMLLLAASMAGVVHLLDDLSSEDKTAAAQCLYEFFHDNPDAPVEAGEIQVKLKLQLQLWPAGEPRRPRLALELFKQAFAGLDAIAGDAAKALALAQAPPAARREVDPEDLSYQKDKGRFERSTTGQALDRTEQNKS